MTKLFHVMGKMLSGKMLSGKLPCMQTSFVLQNFHVISVDFVLCSWILLSGMESQLPVVVWCNWALKTLLKSSSHLKLKIAIKPKYGTNLSNDFQNNLDGLIVQFAELYWALHGPWLLPDKANFTACSIIKLATIAFDETSSYWSALKRS